MLNKNILFSNPRILLAGILNILLLPLYIFFSFISILLAFLPIFPTKIAIKNLQQRLNIQGYRARIFIAKMYLNYVFYFCELFIFSPLGLIISLNKNEFLVFMENVLKKANGQENKTNGLIYISGHLGNLEVASFPVAAFLAKWPPGDKKLYSLAKPTANKLINFVLKILREKKHVKILWTQGNVIMEMAKLLKLGHAIGLFIDQKPPQGGVFIEFFGAYSAFPTAGLRLCLNQRAPVIYTTTRRLLPGIIHHDFALGVNAHIPELAADVTEKEKKIFNFEQIPAKEKMVAVEIAGFASWLEINIKKAPTQWCWDYKKWSRIPG